MTGHFRKEKRTDCIKTCIYTSKKHPIHKIILKNQGLFSVGCETASPIIKFGGMMMFSIRPLNIARCGGGERNLNGSLEVSKRMRGRGARGESWGGEGG